MLSKPTRPPLILPVAEPLAPPADFSNRLAAIGVGLEPSQVALIGDYLGRLIAMNELVNLTRITTPEDAWSRHVLDALTLVPHLAGLQPGARVVDVGSGGGVPGIPLAIARPDLAIALVEATEKKCAFLRAVTRALGLEVDVVAERAEKLATGHLRAAYDAVTARAVAPIETLLGWTAPLAKPGGTLLFIKGERAGEELTAAKSALRRYRCAHERTVLTPTGRVVVLRVG